MRKHVWKILSAQRDLLSPQAVAAVTAAMQDTQRICDGPLDKKAVENQMTTLENVANKWMKKDKPAASAWVQSTNLLPDEVRQRLLGTQQKK